MYFYGFIIVLIVIVGLVTYNEMQKNKRYEEDRQKRLQQKRKPKDTLQVRVKPKEETLKPEVKTTPVKPQIEKVEVKKEQPKKAEPVQVPKQPEEKLPTCEYPNFDHSRLIEMGLGEDDAKDFVGDLINQIDEQIPKIQDAIDDKNVEQLERLTHSIKGSSTNIGVGGVADLLVEFNTYTKSKSNINVIKEYFKQLKVYLQKLKDQYA